MLNRLGFLVVVILFAVGCAPRPGEPGGGPTREQAAQNRARPYIEGAAALEQFKANPDCDGQHAHVVKEKIAELEENVSTFNTIKMRQYERKARQWHTDLTFRFANHAVENGCLDHADQVYRRLIEFYAGPAYSGIRDRARLGIEDVRAAKG